MPPPSLPGPQRPRSAGAGPEVVVTVEDAYTGRIREVAARLEAAGMSVASVLEAAGVITGTAPPGVAAALREVAGVAGVEASRPVRLAPPGAPVQ